MIQKASVLLAALLCAGTLSAQSTTVETPVSRFLSHFDLGALGVGEFNQSVSGPIAVSAPDSGQTISEAGSNTLGALVQVRYVRKPYIGVQFNYGYARYVENFSVSPYQVQSDVAEYTLGYSVNPHINLFGLQPFADAGAGSLEFKPTPHGGQELPRKARMVYYYDLGVQKEFNHLGFRASFRQLFFLAPDFGQNYLTILKHTSTYEPGAGFYIRF